MSTPAPLKRQPAVEPVPAPLQHTPPQPVRQQPASQTACAERPGIVRSDELLRGARELWIEHGDTMYRLRRTSSGKLYLTK